MIVGYTGRGWLVGVIATSCLLLSDLITGFYFHQRDFYSQHGWPKLAGCLVAALAVWWLDTRRPDETLTGAQAEPSRWPTFSKRDTFFFIPAKYWPAILALLGVVFYFVRD